MPPRSIASIRRRSAALSRTTNCRFVPPFLIPPEQHRWSSGAKAKHHAVRGLGATTLTLKRHARRSLHRVLMSASRNGAPWEGYVSLRSRHAERDRGHPLRLPALAPYPATLPGLSV